MYRKIKGKYLKCYDVYVQAHLNDVEGDLDIEGPVTGVSRDE